MHRAVHRQSRASTAYLYIDRLGCNLDELQDVWPDKFCLAKQPVDKNLTSIFRQNMEQCVTGISHVSTRQQIQPLIYWPKQNHKMCVPSVWICRQKQLGNLKPQEGKYIVFQVLVQVCPSIAVLWRVQSLDTQVGSGIISVQIMKAVSIQQTQKHSIEFCKKCGVPGMFRINFSQA